MRPDANQSSNSEANDAGIVKIHTKPKSKQTAKSQAPANTPSLTTSSTSYALAVSHIVQTLITAYDSSSSLNFTSLKSQAARKYKLPGVPRITDILAAIPIEYKPKLLPFLRQKPVRTASGVAVVAVMSKPHRCPHIAMSE
jgi:hypothetical protein